MSQMHLSAAGFQAAGEQACLVVSAGQVGHLPSPNGAVATDLPQV